MQRQFAAAFIAVGAFLNAAALAALAATPAPATAPWQTGTFTIDGPPVDNVAWTEVERRSGVMGHFQGVPNKGPGGNHPESPEVPTRLTAWVPKDYTPDGTWGLLVMPSWSDDPGVPGNYPKICEEHRLLMVTPHNGGNHHYREWRIAQALIARQEMVQRYKIDPQRIYLTGMSGGARISSLGAILFADYFDGALCNSGADTVEIGGVLPPGASDTFTALPELITRARDHNRFYFFTGSKDQNHDDTLIAYNWLKKNMFKYVTFFSQEGAGHGDMDSENFEKGLLALDAPLEPEAAAKAKQAAAAAKAYPGAAMVLYHQAATICPCSATSTQAQAKFDELLATYQHDLAAVKAIIAAGDRVKANAAISNFARIYLPYAKDDVAELRKSASGPAN